MLITTLKLNNFNCKPLDLRTLKEIQQAISKEEFQVLRLL